MKAAAHVKGHPDRSRHQNAEAIVLPEQSADKIRRHMDLIERGQQYPQQEHRTCRPDVAPDILKKPKDHIRVGIPALSLMEPGKVKERSVLSAIERADQPARAAAAQKAGDTPDQDRLLSQGPAVDDQLRIQEDPAHHERGEHIVFDALP